MDRLTWRNERGQACFRMGDTEYVGGYIAERLAAYEDAEEQGRLAMGWTRIEDGTTDDIVLVRYTTEYGATEIDKATYLAEGEALANEWWGSDDWRSDCVDDNGCVKSGWYMISHSAETVYPIDGTVTHWMPLPKADPPPQIMA